eukprot:scaffold101559_cov26-Tisochrysis_lutea.AAC.1
MSHWLRLFVQPTHCSIHIACSLRDTCTKGLLNPVLNPCRCQVSHALIAHNCNNVLGKSAKTFREGSRSVPLLPRTSQTLNMLSHNYNLSIKHHPLQSEAYQHNKPSLQGTQGA